MKDSAEDSSVIKSLSNKHVFSLQMSNICLRKCYPASLKIWNLTFYINAYTLSHNCVHFPIWFEEWLLVAFYTESYWLWMSITWYSDGLDYMVIVHALKDLYISFILTYLKPSVRVTMAWEESFQCLSGFGQNTNNPSKVFTTSIFKRIYSWSRPCVSETCR